MSLELSDKLQFVVAIAQVKLSDKLKFVGHKAIGLVIIRRQVVGLTPES